MITFREFNQQGGISGLDHSNYMGTHDRDNWYVLPMSLSLDSGILQESNFDEALQRLGIDPDDIEDTDNVELHYFSHWFCGNFSLLLINPDDIETVKIAAGIEQDLKEYPILNETDFSERENQAVCDLWNDADMEKKHVLQERIDYCKFAGVSIFAARKPLYEAPDRLYDYLREAISY